MSYVCFDCSSKRLFADVLVVQLCSPTSENTQVIIFTVVLTAIKPHQHQQCAMEISLPMLTIDLARAAIDDDDGVDDDDDNDEDGDGIVSIAGSDY